jgi:hypothetical protein
MRRVSIIVTLTALFLLAACTPVKQTAAPTPVPATPGMGVIKGQLERPDKLWSEGPYTAYAAPFSGDAQGNGFFILEPALHPSAMLDTQGNFQISNVPPGNYVLVIGPSPDESRQVVDEQAKPRIVNVTADQVLELGKVTVAK